MKTKLKFLLPALLGTAVAAPFASAQTAYTDPVGAVVVPVPAGTSVLALPFQHSILFQGAVVSIGSGSVQFSSNLPEISGPHYLQVISGAEEGRIVDVSGVSGDLALIDPSDESTFSAGQIVCLRKHLTLADLGEFPQGASITILNDDFSYEFGTYFFGSWTIDSNTVIRPGHGVVVNTSAFSLTLTGAVATSDVIFELPNATLILGGLDPVNGLTGLLDGLEGLLPQGSTVSTLDSSGQAQLSTVFFGSWAPAAPSVNTANGVILNADIDIALPGFNF